MKSDIYTVAVNENQNWDDPNRPYEVMRIIKKDTGEKVISAFYCKNAYQKIHYHFCACQVSDNEMGIVFDDLYLNIANTNSNVFDALLMHEVGHFIHGDLDKDFNREEAWQERVLQIMKGKVADNELAADSFAVEHCGKNAVMKMLDIVIETRKKRNTPDGEIAIKELELRKQAVKRM